MSWNRCKNATQSIVFLLLWATSLNQLMRVLNLHSLQVFRTKLLHRDHPESPLSPANATASLRERFAAAVRRSNERRDAIERKLCGTLVSTSEFQSPVVFSNSGEYLMTINLGTPAQTFNSVVDTGSDLVWVQCTPCVSCYTQTGPLFDSSKSSSYSVSSCTDTLCSEVSNLKALAHI